mmetsp:Transcript_13976/g.20962  ORF Transcript_13976/g.20962 Transcript_13976/m.20962 type:complete len:107 (-) Transcript_13976:11-331(-)
MTILPFPSELPSGSAKIMYFPTTTRYNDCQVTPSDTVAPWEENSDDCDSETSHTQGNAALPISSTLDPGFGGCPFFVLNDGSPFSPLSNIDAHKHGERYAKIEPSS